MSIPPKLRELIFDRDNGRCQYCGKCLHLGTADCQIDHIIPQIKGGSDSQSNLRLVCRSCNVRKGSRTLEDFRSVFSLSRSKYQGIINKTQAIQLIEKGVELNIQRSDFYFEKPTSFGVSPETTLYKSFTFKEDNQDVVLTELWSIVLSDLQNVSPEAQSSFEDSICHEAVMRNCSIGKVLLEMLNSFEFEYIKTKYGTLFVDEHNES